MKKYLTESLSRKIEILKILTSESLSNKEKLTKIENVQNALEMPKSMLEYLVMTEDEYKEIRSNGKVIQDMSDEKSSKGKDSKLSRRPSNPLKDIQDEQTRNLNRTLVLGDRRKSLDEVNENPEVPDNDSSAQIQSVLSLNNRPSTIKRRSSKEAKKKKIINSKSSAPSEKLVDYISNSGEILYSHLLRNSIAEVDRALLERAKRSGHLSGELDLDEISLHIFNYFLLNHLIKT